ncbi:MAG: isochorismatase, partial [Methyloceanibacter sp.]|nr:isochorismatase [Methyloceanibacter sp.]
MPSVFTPDNSALLLIDHQVGTMQLIKNIPQETAKRNTLALAKMAKVFEMPVVMTSSQEDRAQGLLLSEFETLFREEFRARVKR